MRKTTFFFLAVGTIAGATISQSGVVSAAELLAEADMDGITAGASLSLTTGASVTGSDSAKASSRQQLTGRALPYGGSVVTGHGIARGTATGSETSGTPIVDASGTGDIVKTKEVGKVVDVPGRTIVIGATAGVAITRPKI